MDKSLAYNSVWQVRADAWCRLEEAADGLNRPGTPALKESYTTAVNDLLTLLTPLEPYWAYPGPPQFARVQRLFAAGDYDKFARAVSRINRALTTEVDEVNSISGLLRPTDHIDLMVTAHGTGKNSTDVTFPLLTNVEVLATGQVTHKTEGGNARKTFTTITLSVNPTDAERIVVAKNSGRLTAVLRNPQDANANALTAMNINDVIPKKKGAGNQFAVQYIVGGR